MVRMNTKNHHQHISKTAYSSKIRRCQN